MKRQALLILLLALSTLACSIGVSFAGTVHVVEMDRNFFNPAYLEIEVGDTVRFVNVSGKHNTESIADMLPEGALPWRSKLKETYDLTLTVEGVYGYKCLPHFGKGMVGLIVVGDQPTNLQQAKNSRVPAAAAEVFDSLFERIP